ncbi:STAS domain-containing protein [Actinoplanes oblitus]|uniref:Anti-sigma factor antagonist n=1 Tax=Actinoplanes oblitus TaxID=3040509 RepID=A0ABY8WSU9_9ACTN|nr:STAS domain-containing protein [Actinoplanes oblitus]WIM99867.1 STAS domain-containing protein [Actinoplanes oblitus]
MRIVCHDGPEVTRLVLTGDLDMATTEDLDEHVADVLDGTRPRLLVVDVAGLSFCDSSGIHALLSAQESAQRRGVSFVVSNPVGILRRALRVTGLWEVLTTPSTVP